MGRYWPDGTLEFLGRRDTQVKVAGHRIELGDVEAALLRDPAVVQAAAVVVGSGARARVQGFIVGDGADPEQVLKVARQWLPRQSVPGRVVVLDELPLTTNGKLDRAALVREAGRGDGGRVIGLDPSRDWVARVWGELLQTCVTTAEDSFFALGGNSLVALRFVDRVRQEWQVDLPLRVFLDRPEVGAVAEQLRHLTGGRIDHSEEFEEGEL